jgi:hypothetical protein
MHGHIKTNGQRACLMERTMTMKITKLTTYWDAADASTVIKFLDVLRDQLWKIGSLEKFVGSIRYRQSTKRMI